MSIGIPIISKHYKTGVILDDVLTRRLLTLVEESGEPELEHWTLFNEADQPLTEAETTRRQKWLLTGPLDLIRGLMDMKSIMEKQDQQTHREMRHSKQRNLAHQRRIKLQVGIGSAA